MIPRIRFIRVGVGAIVINAEGQLLLLQKHQGKNELKKEEWTIPGGEVLYDDTIDRAVERELLEEVCLRTRNKTFIDCIDFIQRKAHWLSIVFLIDGFDGTPSVGEPNLFKEIRWFDINQLPNLNEISRLTIERNGHKVHK